MIHIRNSIFGYSNALLQCKELELKRGTCYVLLGRNGAGKSTFLRTLLGEIPAIQGTIQIDGRDINKIRTQELARSIAFVESKTAFADHLRVFEFVSLGRTPYLNPLANLSDLDHQIIHDSLELTGMKGFESRFMDQLSDGERQLASISKAIAQETPCILLDEPSAFLDYANKRKFTELTTNIAQKLNKCILYTSHDVELALASDAEVLGITAALELRHYAIKPDITTVIEQIYRYGRS